jgi:hypothetical protein
MCGLGYGLFLLSAYYCHFPLKKLMGARSWFHPYLAILESRVLNPEYIRKEGGTGRGYSGSNKILSSFSFSVWF